MYKKIKSVLYLRNYIMEHVQKNQNECYIYKDNKFVGNYNLKICLC